MSGCTVATDPEGGGAVPVLAAVPDLLQRLEVDLLTEGLVASRMPAAKLIYLAVTSRLHDRPVSIAVKGPSSAGKSWLVDSVLRFCPKSAYHALTAMSERALIYDDEPLKHRMLLLYEADGMAGDTASYLVRSLLSEGRIRYTTVEAGEGGLQPRTIEREGPTGLITTTTSIALHPENETRILSVPIADTKDSQVAVFASWGADAAGVERASVDKAGWHEMGTWLGTGERRVVLPFAGRLANLLPPHAMRMQRDFIAVLSLVKAHALLHRATREHDEQGRIVATVVDYRAVRELVEPIISAGVDATVKPTMRETVQHVALLGADYPAGVPQRVLGQRLNLDKSATSRRVKDAVAVGYLRDDEPNPGRPSRLMLGDPLPDDAHVLPTAEAVIAEPPGAGSGSRATVQPSSSSGSV